jgi:hypothetical protein
VVPLKAIVLNLLSVGAASGLLVLVFQRRWAEPILGFTSNGSIISWLPLFLFVILFGLSMDYHVFILSRVRESVDEGMTTEAAVKHGITATAGVVTSAAFVMVAVFSLFGSLSSLELKQGRRRPRGRRADRRDDRARGARARIDEAARRVELVPAAFPAAALAHYRGAGSCKRSSARCASARRTRVGFEPK